MVLGMRLKTVTSASIGVSTHSFYFILFSNLHGADIQTIKLTLINVLCCVVKLSSTVCLAPILDLSYPAPCL